MLDQSFSSENFFKIFQIENRKGTFDRDLLPDEYIQIHQKVKLLFQTKALITKQDFDVKLEILNQEKRDSLQKYFERLSELCNNSSFCFRFSSFLHNGKKILTVKKDPPSFFAMKQLQYNIARTFKVKQSNRYDIVKQLRVLLEDGFPKCFLKVDIKSFYESIPQVILLRKVEQNNLLNFYSKKLIKTLVYDYERSKEPENIHLGLGIPRGVGVSAYLSELYMRELDFELQSIEGLVYYARYVDDIVFVFIPSSKEKIQEYFSLVKIIIDKHGLSLKDGSDGEEDKTVYLNLFDKGVNSEFNFLGYKFNINNSKLNSLKLSDNKVEKYKRRISIAVDEYNLSSKYNEKEARKLLIGRLKFLTGNFRLLNNRKRIKSGIYYSNVLLKDNKDLPDELFYLDSVLKKEVKRIYPYNKLKVNRKGLIGRILKRCSFQEGFLYREKKFHSFKKTSFQQIVSVWK